MKITIYLGSRCNLNCAYCHREADGVEPVVSQKLLDLIGDGENKVVRFMGGEPMLYMDAVKQIVASAPKADFMITTNGKDLEPHLPFLAEHNFYITVSYDGAGEQESLRGYDPFTRLLNYPRLGVSCTIYHGNTDLQKIMRRFAEKEKIIGRPIRFYPHIIHVTGEHNARFGLTKDDCDGFLAQLKEAVGGYMDGIARYGVENIKFRPLFAWLVRSYNRPYQYGETYCVHRDLKKVDAAGNQYTCLYVRQTPLSENWQKEQADILDRISPACRECPVYGMCGGACIVSKRRDIECYYYKNLFTWFKAAYERFLKEVPHAAKSLHIS